MLRTWSVFPHIFVWGSCFWFCIPAPPPSPPPPRLLHISSFTHNFVTHHLSHTTLSHIIFHIHGKRGTWRHVSSFHVAGVALGDVCLRFTWQAWHLATCASFRGTWRHPPSFCVASVALMALGWLWWRAWTGLVAGDAATLCLAGVALGDIHLRFTWQAWHLVTSTFVLRGKRGTYGTGLALVARLDWISRRWRRGTLRGRRGIWWHPPSSHVAGVALGDIHLNAWQVWHLWHWAGSGSGGALGLD